MRTSLVVIAVVLTMLPLPVSGEEPTSGASVVVQPNAAAMARIVARGDIRRNSPPKSGQEWLPLYQGNGRMGCGFGPWGLHAHPKGDSGYTLHGVTSLMHIEHFTRGKFGADYVLPLFDIYWQQEPEEVSEYEQHQSFYDGTVRTRYRTKEYAVTILTWIDPIHREMAGIRIDVEGNCPKIIVAPRQQLKVHYDQQLEQTFTSSVSDGAWHAILECQDARTPVVVRSSAKLTTIDEGVSLHLAAGRNELLLTVGESSDVSGEESLRDTLQWWHSTWANSGWLDLPDDDAQQVWVRSLAYIFSTYNDDGLGEATPMGFAGNNWPFPFPFDNSCQHPILIATGKVDIARKWVEYWHSHIDGLKHYTQHLWKRQGIGFPHVFPYGPFQGYHHPEAPNRFYYPLYNSSIMIRMADHTAKMVDDPEWTRQYVEPLIQESALFYLDIAQKHPDGLWHFSVNPSIGLDEHGGVNQPDYICTLFAAEYVLRQAITYGLDRDGRCAAILRDGIAYQSLLTPDGKYYFSNAGTGAQDKGHQKHPDQLFPLAHLQLGRNAGDPTKYVHARRYELTAEADKSSFAGHTIGEFLLSSARMHDVEGWRKDWSQLQLARIADPDWIQFYESSGRSDVYYITTHGLIAQALLETIVSTWWGELDLAACLPWKGDVRFGSIRTPLGVTVSGYIIDGKGQATVEAWKDTSFTYQGRTISLQRGESTSVPIRSED